MTALAHRPTTAFPTPVSVTAAHPPETAGLRRDEVRLLVASGSPGGSPVEIEHVRFHDIGRFLDPGDVLVVNTSATVAAEVGGVSARHGRVVVHLATPLDDGTWVVELRTSPDAARAVLDAEPGDEVDLGGSVTARLQGAYPEVDSSPTGTGNRLWRAAVTGAVGRLLAERGRPIAYGYLDARYPLGDYQTVFSVTPGSAEMPSAGRPFTPELVTRLVCAGVQLAPILLHTGVSSQEAGEAPQPERFSVSAVTARVVNQARAAGGRIVAVGTTATRAIESAASPDGLVRPATGWTDLVISPDRPVRVVDGLVTGWHDPEASHLLLVESVAGPDLTQGAYDAALSHAYRWHEFGDSCLLLPAHDGSADHRR